MVQKNHIVRMDNMVLVTLAKHCIMFHVEHNIESYPQVIHRLSTGLSTGRGTKKKLNRAIFLSYPQVGGSPL